MGVDPMRKTDGRKRGRIELIGLKKSYGALTVVNDLDLKIEGGEFFTILGPSGCGKTTTLMMLAGFVDPSGGDLMIDDTIITDVPPQHRDIGVVFQNYALFPHMTVAQNLAFPLEMRGVARAEIESRVAEVLDLVQLPAADRYPAQLSGGQQQRVAVARAVIFNPPVLLMDEPLGALDRKLRVHLQSELRHLQQRLGVTVVYVTHDQDEAMSMSDRIAVMNGGRLEQLAGPTELYEEPASLFVARFLGDNNVFHGAVASAEGGITVDGGRTLESHATKAPKGARVSAALRPERVRLGPEGTEGHAGRVTECVYLGAQSEFLIDIPGIGEVRAVVQNTGDHHRWQPGDAVAVRWKAADLRLFPEAPSDTGQ